jgi:hypothetical protein
MRLTLVTDWDNRVLQGVVLGRSLLLRVFHLAEGTALLTRADDGVGNCHRVIPISCYLSVSRTNSLSSRSWTGRRGIDRAGQSGADG